MFREITKEANLRFVHQPNPELWRRRAVLEVPVGIAGWMKVEWKVETDFRRILKRIKESGQRIFTGWFQIAGLAGTSEVEPA